MPPRKISKAQGKGKSKAVVQQEEEEEGSSTNGAEDIQNLKWERHFYYHEEEEREVRLPIRTLLLSLIQLLELYD